MTRIGCTLPSLARGAVEVRDFESGREAGLVFEAGDRLEWTPVGEGPTLEVVVGGMAGEPAWRVIDGLGRGAGGSHSSRPGPLLR